MSGMAHLRISHTQHTRPSACAGGDTQSITLVWSDVGAMSLDKEVYEPRTPSRSRIAMTPIAQADQRHFRRPEE